MHVPGLRTRQLLLRPPRLTDAVALHATISNPQACRFLPIGPSPGLDVTRDYVARCQREAAERDTLTWLLSPQDAPDDICGLVQAQGRTNRFDVGFLLHPDAWGQGWMAEALLVVLDWMERQDDSRVAQAICDVDNLAATRMLSKAGFSVAEIRRAFRVHPACGPSPRDCAVHLKALRETRRGPQKV